MLSNSNTNVEISMDYWVDDIDKGSEWMKYEIVLRIQIIEWIIGVATAVILLNKIENNYPK